MTTYNTTTGTIRLVRALLGDHCQHLMLSLIDPLGSEALTYPSSPTSPPIGFHVWHSARWADLAQSNLLKMAPQFGGSLPESGELWIDGGWAARFSSGNAALGYLGTGMEAAEHDLLDLPFHDADLVKGYAHAAFTALEDAVAVLDDGALAINCIDLYGGKSTIGAVLLGHVVHISRHLGMIEALIGTMGQTGTATC